MQSNKKKLNTAKLLVHAAALLTFSAVSFIILYVLLRGVPELIGEIGNYFSGAPSLFDFEYNSDNVSIIPATVNTVVMIFFAITISSFLGISTAIYLVEYASSDSKIVGIIRLTSETLAGIPSIIYGLFGWLFFITFLKIQLSVWVGILTISIMILPLIIRSTEEALKAVPQSYREASFGLGAAKLRTIFVIILPSAMNGILAGVILAIGRIIGETAALIFTSGTTSNMALNPFTSGGRTLAVHIYMLTSEGIHFPQAYATSAIVLGVIIAMNALSSFLAKKLMKG